ncbi:MAG: hypothetical protein B6I20_01350, partial [Bacteroidetes bacterium 4572_117]
KMKIQVITALLLLTIIESSCVFSQQIKGEIVHQKDNITVIKVWGTHKERGFAYGYLGGEKILQLFKNYITPALGSNLAKARIAISSQQYIQIENKYIDEAKAIIEGMKAAKVDLKGFNYNDLLLANSFLDIRGLGKNNKLNNGCSSLMSWGSATKGTSLKGESVITRHLDWSVVPTLTNNNLILVHIPAETDEQPWLMVGYFGQMSVLSGCNKAGLSIFQHMMKDDMSEVKSAKYTPIWFSLRKALEQKDYNQDGYNDVNDLKAVLISNKDGYANTYIICALAAAIAKADNQIAMVAEIGPNKPHFTFRGNLYDDKINGDNLYAANYPIKRNNRRRYGGRYNSINKFLANGVDIDAEKSWDIMTTYSILKARNLQTMQIIPKSGVLKLSIWLNNKDAYKNKAQIFNIHELFKK